MTKQDIFLLKSQQWFFEQAKPYLLKKGVKEIPFGQPPVNFKGCLKWYKVAKAWHSSLILAKEEPIIPPPPEPPPKRPG